MTVTLERPASRISRGWLALSASRVLSVLLFAGIFIFNFFAATDPDLWWHLATGRYIVETGIIPHTDLFSYTAVGQSRIAHEWLAEVVMYILYRAGGYLLPVSVFASLVTLAFLAVFRALRAMQVGSNAAVFITLWVAVMSMPSWNVRPQVFSYLFFSVYLYILVRSRTGTDRWIWALPAIMVVWVNLHAGYIMGLIVLGLFLLGEGINRWRSPVANAPHEMSAAGNLRAAEDRSLALRLRRSIPARLVAVAVATVAATAVHPQGLAALLYPLSYAGTQNASMKFISEWQSPDFHNYFFFIFAASFMLLAVRPSKRGTDWALTLPVLVLLAMTLQSIRVLPFYAITVAPLLAQRLIGDRLFEPTANGQAGTGGARTRRSSATPLNWLLLAASLAVLSSTLFLVDRTQLGPEPITAKYPRDGVAYLGETGITGNLFNLYHWGGFLVWSFYPERVVFIDGRADMYGDSFVEEYMTVSQLRPGWNEVLSRYGVGTVLVEKDGLMATLLHASPEWEEIFQGPIESVFRRVLSP